MGEAKMMHRDQEGVQFYEVFACLLRKFKPQVIFSSPYISQVYKHKGEVYFYLCLQTGCSKLE